MALNGRILNAMPRLLNVMHRRLLALVLGLFVAGAPEALEACQVFCAGGTHAERSTHAGHAAHGHSCRQEAASIVGLGLRAIPHVCGHDEALPTAGQQLPQVTTQPAILVTISPFSILARSAQPIAPAVRRKPPGLALTAQLRV